ncbi:hypothetical protein FXB39_06160 [Nocardioides sp. BGMRC 2183]|nr:hypothetical protein FXB39_06160 [Nocardioides sp. BGMRC 2183]
MKRIVHLLSLSLIAAGLAAVVGATASPVEAAGRITVRNDVGGSSADTRYQTKLTISGSGFQSVAGGFGGVYLMFGWVDDPSGGSWKPSRGGVTGSDYRYIPDSEGADNAGYLKFIAFPGGSTATEAHAVLSKSGSFSVDLVVPGPTFQSVDRNGKVQEVDCTKVTCGVITIGAHGVKNPANETFTPVAFSEIYDNAPSDNDDTTPEQGGTTPSESSTTPAETTPDAPVKRTKRGVTIDHTTAQAGHALTFTGGGFTPGEQVVGVLDDGVAAIGPMLAGEAGEVAGVLQLPADLAAGTHQLKLTGAASGATVKQRFAVRGAPEPAPATEAEEADEQGAAWWDGSRIFLAGALLVFVLALAGCLVQLQRRRSRQRAARTSGLTPAGGV